MYSGSLVHIRTAPEAITNSGQGRVGVSLQLFDLPGIDVIGILLNSRVLPVRLSALILLILISGLIINI